MAMYSMQTPPLNVQVDRHSNISVGSQLGGAVHVSATNYRANLLWGNIQRKLLHSNRVVCMHPVSVGPSIY